VLAPSLTGREEQVLRLVAAGLSNRQIAEQLGLRPQTVKNHVRRVFEKTDVHSRLELIGALRGPPARYQYRGDSPGDLASP
jgi:DNA-binding CsgD family transcriptional regulator